MGANAKSISHGRALRRPKSPAEVAPGVFVGGWKDAVAFEGTRFCVLDEKPEDMPPATHIPIYDDRSGSAIHPNLDRLAREIEAARAQGRPVLIFCGHGIRRSPLGAAWYLHRSEKLSLTEAFERVRAVRPRAEPPVAWMGKAASLEGA
ncbi:MAG TPA: dual specificity protein phosphatase family protein [Thermoplasmata archaeon]|nr:dual specificity protein phosphatase family protein [Thermoplasmata archaeon]